jgi:DNA-directed RNA polymerase subunit RPC12/RpoP
MFHVCQRCGMWRRDKRIDPTGPYAICPECGHRHPFKMLPLLIVSGAGGAGKSSICQALAGAIEEAVLLEGDIIWRPEFNKPDENYRGFFEAWLRIAMNIGQSGRPVVLFGAGMGAPANLEPCVHRRYFSRLSYLALVCDDAVLAERLRMRPEWRGCADPAFIAAQQRFNRWFREEGAFGNPPVDLIETTGVSPAETATQVAAWIRSELRKDAL